MPESPWDEITKAVDEAHRKPAAQVDEYLVKMAEALSMTIPEMAEQYELEYHPLDIITEHPATLRATQSLRLVPRAALPDTEAIVEVAEEIA